jgi:hypothetical protein
MEVPRKIKTITISDVEFGILPCSKDKTDESCMDIVVVLGILSSLFWFLDLDV